MRLFRLVVRSHALCLSVFWFSSFASLLSLPVFASVIIFRDDGGDMHLSSGYGPCEVGLPGDRISSLHWNY